MKNQGYESRRQGGGMGFLGGILLGGLMGAVAGLLFAPRSGDETRLQLREGLETARERSGKVLDDWRGNAGDLMGSARQRLGSRFSLLTEAIDAGRRAAGEVRRDWRERGTAPQAPTEQAQNGESQG